MPSLTRLYLAFRHPRVFLIALLTFVITSLALHFLRGYDSDFGATNLTLSIEASIASAVLTMMAEKAAEMQQRIAEQMQQMLQSLLAMAESARERDIEQLALMRALREADERLLKALTEKGGM
ncbi:hypothetical protein WK62_05160 [Burkholderia ubonensis]|uniref:hypothetical protein n=1 Tax=Burkholderia ubonensis TaxID=101571 RepID=UPI0007562097|nr:hypothetical protein [Burkholderia ubonensis]KVU10654.1 hypothetical protein WK62_05160 [Burkholderia ubonensis]